MNFKESLLNYIYPAHPPQKLRYSIVGLFAYKSEICRTMSVAVEIRCKVREINTKKIE